MKTQFHFARRLWLALVGATFASGALASHAQADGTVTIGTSDVTQLKSWGMFPAHYDRQVPTWSNGVTGWSDSSWLPGGVPNESNRLFVGFRDLQFDTCKVGLSPLTGKSDNTLEAARLQDLKDHLQAMRDMGITKYMITVGSPPAHMKIPDRVRWGVYEGRTQSLDPAFADGVGYDFADYLVAVVVNLRSAGFPPPVAISPQNEPNTVGVGDTCAYNAGVWRSVVKGLRSKLNAAGFSGVPVVGPEHAGVGDIEAFLGTASASGFTEMNNDTAFRDALGGFAYHTYFTSAKIRTMNQAMDFYPGRDRWMTEYSSDMGIVAQKRPYSADASAGGSGNQELNWSLNNMRRMAADLVDFKTNHWYWWGGWHLSRIPGYQDLMYDLDGDVRMTKAYWVFQRLWRTVKPGWKVKTTTTTEPDLATDNLAVINGYEPNGNMMSQPVDIVAFESPDGTQSCVLLCNWKNETKNITALSGLKNSGATIYQTTTSLDMAPVGTRSVAGGTLGGGNLTLPGYSITLVVSGVPGPATGFGNGLTGQYYSGQSFNTLVQTRTDAQVNFQWNDGGPMGSVGPNSFSVRWTGQVQAIESGLYTFTTTTDDGVRLWVNNQLLVDKWNNQAPTPWSGTIRLTEGQRYDIKMEYFENDGGAMASLAWTRPGQGAQLIPQSQLYTARTTNALLSQNKPTFVSSTESGGNVASNAVDGLANTRWSSQFSDPQWIYVDLGRNRSIAQIKLNWEVAAGKDYVLQIAPDGSANLNSDAPWQTLRTVTNNTTTGVLTYDLAGYGRYVRLKSTARATPWGNSLWEFQVFGY